MFHILRHCIWHYYLQGQTKRAVTFVFLNGAMYTVQAVSNAEMSKMRTNMFWQKIRAVGLMLIRYLAQGHNGESGDSNLQFPG